jgi:hypothetical protein
MDDEEPVLMELANSLSNFLEYIGGVKYIEKLIKLYEGLFKSFDAEVREKVKFK